MHEKEREKAKESGNKTCEIKGKNDAFSLANDAANGTFPRARARAFADAIKADTRERMMVG